MKPFTVEIIPHILRFKQPAGTSRGTYTERKVWYVKFTAKDDPTHIGIGECAPLPDLSCDDLPDYEAILSDFCRQTVANGVIDTEALRVYPSILFGLETAFRHFQTQSFALWDTPFSQGSHGIPINGLIWMGDSSKMLSQIEDKLVAGFRCIKLKIGTIRFEEELELLYYIRRHFGANELELRVDANGAFSPNEAIDKLNRLAELNIHSIEQPIRAGQWEEMARLAATSPIPIALDEELIGIHNQTEKQRLLATIQPQYIILKPSLHGGFCGSEEWIREAEQVRAGWWITSALESNIGLNAIAQWCATHENPLPQGLGTGALFVNNISLPLEVRRDSLWFAPLQPILNTDSDRQLFAIDRHAAFRRELNHFIAEWSNDTPTLTLQTSGSTGQPKQITVRKEQMRQSARQTNDFLGLQPGDTALLCMPLQYIAGKMMVVRALERNLRLIVRQPSGHPLADVDTPVRFAAMVPMQVYNTLQQPDEVERLKAIDILIIGGGFINDELKNRLRDFPNKIYATYGMTETLSHIALRRINGEDRSEYYTPFPGIKLTLSTDHALVIDLPYIDQPLETNDIAELLPDGRFRILGRKDNVINTGGIKVQAEELEAALHLVIDTPYAITSVSDPRLGEAIVLLVENEKTNSPSMDMLYAQICRQIPTHQQPKMIIPVANIPLTATGKIDRKACKNLAFIHSKSSSIR